MRPGRCASHCDAGPAPAHVIRRARAWQGMIEAIANQAPGFKPRVAVILGSGLGSFTEEVKAVATIPYGDLPGFPQTTVGSHAGKLVLGHIGRTAVAVLQGRAHYYERGR